MVFTTSVCRGYFTKTCVNWYMLFLIITLEHVHCMTMKEQAFWQFVSNLSENQLKVCKTAPRAIQFQFCRIVEAECQIDRCSNHEDPLAVYLTFAPCPPPKRLSSLCTIKSNLTCEEKAQIFKICTEKFQYPLQNLCESITSCTTCSAITNLRVFRNKSCNILKKTSKNEFETTSMGVSTMSVFIPTSSTSLIAAESNPSLKDIYKLAVALSVVAGLVFSPMVLCIIILCFRRRNRKQKYKVKCEKQTSVLSTLPLLESNGGGAISVELNESPDSKDHGSLNTHVTSDKMEVETLLITSPNEDKEWEDLMSDADKSEHEPEKYKVQCEKQTSVLSTLPLLESNGDGTISVVLNESPDSKDHGSQIPHDTPVNTHVTSDKMEGETLLITSPNEDKEWEDLMSDADKSEHEPEV